MPEAERPEWIPPLDPEALFKVLARHRVNYVLIGALAASFQGFPRLTMDADITPELAQDNLGRLAAALGEMEAKLRVPGLQYGVEMALDDRSFSQGSTWTFVTRLGPVDVVLRPDGTEGYEDLNKDAVAYKVFGVDVRVSSIPDIIRSKEAARRPRDLDDVRLLREIRNRTSGD